MLRPGICSLLLIMVALLAACDAGIDRLSIDRSEQSCQKPLFFAAAEDSKRISEPSTKVYADNKMKV